MLVTSTLSRQYNNRFLSGDFQHRHQTRQLHPKEDGNLRSATHANSSNRPFIILRKSTIVQILKPVPSKGMQVPRTGKIPQLPPSSHFPFLTAQGDLCACAQLGGHGYSIISYSTFYSVPKHKPGKSTVQGNLRCDWISRHI